MRYRFFVSYTKSDSAVAKAVVEILQQHGHFVKEMEQLTTGVRFPLEIRQWIDWSHFVIPVITEKSKDRPWIHQEIGYALGRHLPVVPIVFNCRPHSRAFLDDVQVIAVDRMRDLMERLSEKQWQSDLAKIIKDLSLPVPVSTCDDDAQSRSRLLARTAAKIGGEFPGRAIRIRQSSRLTSFSVPRDLTDARWQRVQKRANLFWLYPPERENLQKLVDRGGCDLRINPDYYEPGYLRCVQLARLHTLLDFLRRQPDEKVNVVVENKDSFSETQTIIGDHWFSSSAAVAPFGRLRKTISTWHAPTVDWYRQKFDGEFENALQEQSQKISPKSSRVYAAERIEQAIKKL